MDQIKQEFLKKLTKFIVISIWVSSLLVTHNFYLYRFIIQLVTHAVDKKYMFLLCNGLLAFVAKCIVTSKPVDEGWSKTDKTFDYQDFESYDAILELEYDPAYERGSEFFLAEEVSTKDQETDDEKVEKETKEDQETEEEKKEEEEYDEPLTDTGDLEEEEEEEEDNVGVVREEEMNKKFDEFIRKMKEELRIEAKRQLIVV